MFTLHQIAAVHAQVKSGADFPAYVQNMKKLGVEAYDLHVADGRSHYRGNAGFSLESEPKWPTIHVAGEGNTAALQHALLIHQRGETDYPTFVDQAAAAGVHHWTVDMNAMTCIYYDQAGNELVEEVIPGV